MLGVKDGDGAAISVVNTAERPRMEASSAVPEIIRTDLVVLNVMPSQEFPNQHDSSCEILKRLPCSHPARAALIVSLVRSMPCQASSVE
jgi:hypothetical protein